MEVHENYVKHMEKRDLYRVLQLNVIYAICEADFDTAQTALDKLRKVYSVGEKDEG